MRPDAERDVVCILGLPIDIVDESQAIERLRRAVRERRRCFLSTPNLNFAVASTRDAAFRESVLHSDLNTADGMPLVWIARLLGVRLPERVAGSALFERLRESDGNAPLKVYFFGGPEGIAERACKALNEQAGGLRGVGFDAPGFGTVEQMSSAERIARINASGADIVVVSLGAKKGQAWIERNRARLHAPVISHLGAVVNFVAGSVRRAPRAWQRVGLEWLWRIVEEPSLWRRYGSDGLALLALVFTRVLPLAWHLRSMPSADEASRARADAVRRGREVELRLSGAWTARNIAGLRAAVAAVAASADDVRVDVAALTYIDACAVAQLALLHGACSDAARGWQLIGASRSLQRVLHWCCAEYLLQPASAMAAMGEEKQAC